MQADMAGSKLNRIGCSAWHSSADASKARPESPKAGALFLVGG